MSIWQALIQVLAAAMVVSIVCRLTKMNENTREAVRLAIVAHGTSAFALAIIPFGKPHWLPWLVLGYMSTEILVQFATSYYWSHGQPRQFVKDVT